MAKRNNFSSAMMDMVSPTGRGRSMPQSVVWWEKKIPKAAAAVSYMSGRHILFDQAVQRPDLFDVSFSCPPMTCNISPWNPSSNEPDFNSSMNYSDPALKKIFFRKDPGFVGGVLPLQKSGKTINVGGFKFLVVMTGGYNSDTLAALTGKLAAYLSYSGAVVMLQKSEFRYHFSGRLRPWVHYVPLSYSMAELTSLLDFLQ
eukprot:gene27909-36767_t